MIQHVDVRPLQLLCNIRTVTWTVFNMPSLIQQNSRQIAITYGADRAKTLQFDGR